MAKVGLKETLSLLAAGYKKKDIEALAAIDDELEDTSLSSTTAQEVVPPPESQKEEKEEDPDYKKLYEDLLEKNKQTEAKVTKLQQANVNTDSAPASEETLKKQEEDLQNLFRSFM